MMTKLKAHINETFEKLGISEAEKDELWALLGRLKANPELWEAFKDIGSQELLQQPQPLSTIIPNATLFPTDFGEVPDLEIDSQEEKSTAAKDKGPALTMDLFFDNASVLDIEQAHTPHTPADTQPTLGRYIDMGLLGKGGMGEVRKVKDRALNRELAMKIIHPNILKNQSALSRFIEEAQVGAQLQHPNIVPIHELGTLSDGRYYFTMTEIKGRGFNDLIKSVHAVSTDQAWKTAMDGTSFQRLMQIFYTSCKTMAYSHSLGVVHRDLKPENIMIGDFGEALIVDWGIAKVLGRSYPDRDDFVQTDRSDQKASATRMGMVAGTPNYMSPEQAMGRIDLIDVQSDVYTLGAILYEILSGKPPYTGQTALEIIEKVKTTQPPSLSTDGHSKQNTTRITKVKSLQEEATSKIPSPLIAICERAMARTISDRYPSATELATDVLGWLEGTQKRERALKEVDAANQHEQSAIRKEAHHRHCIQEADRILLQEGFGAKGTWQKWNEGMQAQSEAKQCRLDHRNTLQGALVHDPELEEAHDALAELVMAEWLVAKAKRAHRQQALLAKQLQGHLPYLSKTRQKELKATLKKSNLEKLTQLRARRKGEFVGRKTETERLAGFLERSQLISVVGMAGVGKTHLALESAYQYSKKNQGEVLFCDLTLATDITGILRAVATALNIKINDRNPTRQIGEALAGKGNLLLLLDNVEQVRDEVVPIVEDWLTQAESAKILLTSRVRLHRLGDRFIQLMPLSTIEAIALFVQCAQAHHPNMAQSEESFQAIARIVKRLDNLPLAVELVAARASMLSISEIETRLSSCFDLASSRLRSDDQRALQGALDWSYELLSDWAKSVFAQCSVFHNGFAILAAEQVVDLSNWPEAPSVLDAVEVLCDDSLILKETQANGSIRYRMLLSIQDYASKSLPKSHRDADGKPVDFSAYLSRRHADYFSHYAQGEYRDALDGFGKTERRQALFVEFDNLLKAGRADNSESAALCCIAVLKVALFKGPISLGIPLANSILEREGMSAETQLSLLLLLRKSLRNTGEMAASRALTALQDDIMDRLLNEVGLNAVSLLVKEQTGPLPKPQQTIARLKAEALTEQGDIECDQCAFDLSHTHHHDALTIYKRLDHRNGMTKSFNNLGILYGKQNKPSQALPYFEQALDYAQKTQNTIIQGRVLSNLATIFSSKNQPDKAEKSYREAIECHRSSGNRHDECKSLGGLGTVLRKKGHYHEAIECQQQAIEIAAQLGNRSTQAANLSNIGFSYLCLEKTQQALSCYQQALRIQKQIGNKIHEGITLGSMGDVYERLEQWEEAKKHYKDAIEVCSSISHPASHSHRHSLALLFAKDQEFSTALQLLDESKDGLKRFPYQNTTSLCKRAKTFLLANMPTEAQSAIRQAIQLMQSHRFQDEELKEEIRSLSVKLGVENK